MKLIDKLIGLKGIGRQYVVAEVGSNYHSKDDLFGAISLAQRCGADAVKYQYFTESELYGPTPQLDQDFPLELLAEEAKAMGIDFLCTAFSPAGLARVDPFVQAHKIASSEMSYVDLLDAAKASRKPVILSTGGSFIPDINRVIKYMADTPLVVTHCNHSYPARYVDIKKFSAIRDIWNGLIGFSDHTTSIDIVPTVMCQVGVTVYEKHFNPFGYTDTPDAGHSLNRDEFKCMVNIMRQMPSEYSEEGGARLMHLRRVVATADINPGDLLKSGVNMGVFRSRSIDASGLNPFAIDKLEGSRAVKFKAKGEGLCLGDIGG